MAARVTLKGDLAKRMRAGERKSATAVRQTTKGIAAGAQKRAPRDTNHLADESISIERIDEHTAFVLVQTADDTHEEYSRHVELGTVKAAAQPFLIPAAEAERQPFVRRVRTAYAR